MKAVILCGGRGTRLREVSDLIPKPMVPIGDKPILWHIMKTLCGAWHHGLRAAARLRKAASFASSS